MYRPKSWKNPTEELIRKGSHSNFSNGELGFLSAEYEAGADAMLAALKEEGWHIGSRDTLGYGRMGEWISSQPPNGTYVFIPDEEHKN